MSPPLGSSIWWNAICIFLEPKVRFLLTRIKNKTMSANGYVFDTPKINISCFFVGPGTATPTVDVQTPIGNNSVTAGNQTYRPARDNHSHELRQELRRAYLFEELLWREIELANVTELTSMGHKFKDLVFDCHFRGIDCRWEKDFLTSVSSKATWVRLFESRLTLIQD